MSWPIVSRRFILPRLSSFVWATSCTCVCMLDTSRTDQHGCLVDDACLRQGCLMKSVWR